LTYRFSSRAWSLNLGLLKSQISTLQSPWGARSFLRVPHPRFVRVGLFHSLNTRRPTVHTMPLCVLPPSVHFTRRVRIGPRSQPNSRRARRYGTAASVASADRLPPPRACAGSRWMRERATVYRWKRGPSGPRKAALNKRGFSPGPPLARQEIRAARSLNRTRSGPRARPPKPCHPSPGGTDDPVGALRSSRAKSIQETSKQRAGSSNFPGRAIFPEISCIPAS